MSYGIDYEARAQEYVQNNRYYTSAQNRYSTGQNTTNGSIFNEPAVSEKGNTCTDGKDDGKIGFFSAVGNIIQGAGKAIVNGVKGMFCDSDGHFSLGKTLKTVAMGALCVAFPAVGLALCGVGILSGGIKIATGVVNALGADTDAEAKDMWEQVGEGGLILGTSIVGAKASMNAIGKTSTAGAEALGYTKAEASQLNALGENTSAMGQLGENATILQKAGALWKDTCSSTGSRFRAIGSEIGNIYKCITKQEGAPKFSETCTGKFLNTIKEKIKTSSEKIKTSHERIKNIDKELEQSRAQYENLKATSNEPNLDPDVQMAEGAIKYLEGRRAQATQETTFGKLTTFVRTQAGKASEYVTSALKKNGGPGLLKAIRSSGASVLKSAASAFKNPTQTAIYKALTNSDLTYNQIINKYGYNNVLDVLTIMYENEVINI